MKYGCILEKSDHDRIQFRVRVGPRNKLHKRERFNHKWSKFWKFKENLWSSKFEYILKREICENGSVSRNYIMRHRCEIKREWRNRKPKIIIASVSVKLLKEKGIAWKKWKRINIIVVDRQEITMRILRKKDNFWKKFQEICKETKEIM